MRRTTITLPEDLCEAVELEARRRGESVSSLIRELVASGLPGAPHKVREIPFAGLFSDPGMVSGAALDEALAESWADDVDRDRR